MNCFPFFNRGCCPQPTERTVCTRPVNPCCAYASFVNPTTGIIPAESALVLIDDINMNPANIVHTPNSTTVSLNPGFYLVSYVANAVSASAGNVSIGLNVNGTTLINGASVATAPANETVVLSSQKMIKVQTENTILSLVNNGVLPTTYNNVSVVIRQICCIA